MNRSRIPLCGLGLIVTAASLIAAAPAAAGTLAVDYGTAAATYKAAAGETNKVSVMSLGPSTTLIQDAAVKEVPLGERSGTACVPMEPWKYKCSGVATVNVDLADGSDVFDGATSGVTESVEAGAGAKVISTGGGNDRVSARNGAADQISCGAGADAVVGDSKDVVAKDCEYTDLGDGIVAGAPDAAGPLADGPTGTAGATGPGSAAPRGAATGLQTALGLILPPRALILPRPGTAIVPLACAATATAGCRGDVVLEVPAGSAKARRSAKLMAARGHYVAQQRARRLGSRRFRLAAGQKTALPVRIRFRGHFTAVEKRRRRRAVLKISERDAAGKVADVQTRVVTLNLSSNSPRRHR